MDDEPMNPLQLFELSTHVKVPGNSLMATHRWGERLLTELNARRAVMGSVVHCAHGRNCHGDCADCVKHFSNPARNPISMQKSPPPRFVTVGMFDDEAIVAEYERRSLASPRAQKAEAHRIGIIVEQRDRAERWLKESRDHANEFERLLDEYETLANVYGKPASLTTRLFIEATLMEAQSIARGVRERSQTAIDIDRNQQELTETLAKAMLGPMSLPPQKWLMIREGVACPHSLGLDRDGLCRDCGELCRQVVKVASIEPSELALIERSNHTTMRCLESGPGISRLPEPQPEGHYVLDVDLLCDDE